MTQNVPIKPTESRSSRRFFHRSSSRLSVASSLSEEEVLDQEVDDETNKSSCDSDNVRKHELLHQTAAFGTYKNPFDE